MKLIRLGYYYIDCGDPAEALPLTDQLLKSTPDHIDAMTLKADAYLTMQDETAALEWYQNALRSFYHRYPNSYEAPEYLLSQIAVLQQRE
jgi:Tfp pilus assembly protein PilF